MPNGWCQRHAQLGFEHWVLDGPQTVGFCDLLGTPYAPVSKIPSVKAQYMRNRTIVYLLKDRFTIQFLSIFGVLLNEMCY